MVTKVFADGRDDVVETIPCEDWVETTINGAAYYYLTFSDISGKEMSDNICVTIYNAEDEAISNQYTDSIRAYIMRTLDNTGSELDKMLVDMLVYGAAAQEYYAYGTDDLATVQLSADQLAYGTQEMQACTDDRVKGDRYLGSRLQLKNSINLQMSFSGLTTDMTAKIEFTNHRGVAVEETVNAVLTEDGQIVIDISQIVAADGRCDVTVTVYDADGNVYGSATDSIESYVARTSSTNEVYELTKAVMSFSDSAYAYFH